MCRTVAAHCALLSSLPCGFVLITPPCLDLFPSCPASLQCNNNRLTSVCSLVLVPTYPVLLTLTGHTWSGCSLVYNPSRDKSTVDVDLCYLNTEAYSSLLVCNINDFTTESCSFVKGLCYILNLPAKYLTDAVVQSPHCFFWVSASSITFAFGTNTTL